MGRGGAANSLTPPSRGPRTFRGTGASVCQGTRYVRTSQGPGRGPGSRARSAEQHAHHREVSGPTGPCQEPEERK